VTTVERTADADVAAAEAAPRGKAARGWSEVFSWPRLVAYAFAAATLALASPAQSVLWPWGFVGGAALAVVGEALRVWGCGHLRKNKDVISSGPYAYVRNPLYLGTLLIVVGFCVAAGNKVVLYGLLPAALLAFFVYYTPKKERVESERLRRCFGARFDAYHAAVPGYLPRVTRWSDASKLPWSGPLALENSEGSTAAFVAIGLAVLAARAFL
jgi:protein-S-isoprenylcysteine O-methyltransferase Ste14